MINKLNLTKLVSDEKTGTIERNKDRIRNRELYRESQKISLVVLNIIEDLGWSKEKLSIEMGISLEKVNKIVSGKEILSDEIKILIENTLDINFD